MMGLVSLLPVRGGAILAAQIAPLQLRISPLLLYQLFPQFFIVYSLILFLCSSNSPENLFYLMNVANLRSTSMLINSIT